MQAVQDLARRQRPHPRRRQLDRQRHTVEACADLGHSRGIVVAERETVLSTAGPIDEQLEGFTV